MLRHIYIGELSLNGPDPFQLLLLHDRLKDLQSSPLMMPSSGGDSSVGFESSVKNFRSSSLESVGMNGAFYSLLNIFYQEMPLIHGCCLISSDFLKPSLFYGFFYNNSLRKSLRGSLLMSSSGGGMFFILLMVVAISSFCEKKGGKPTVIQNIKEPKVHQSASKPNSFSLLKVSGGRKQAVPAKSLFEMMEEDLCQVQSPKSTSLIYPSSSNTIFSGLRLRQKRVTPDRLFQQSANIPKLGKFEQHRTGNYLTSQVRFLADPPNSLDKREQLASRAVAQDEEQSFTVLERCMKFDDERV